MEWRPQFRAECYAIDHHKSIVKDLHNTRRGVPCTHVRQGSVDGLSDAQRQSGSSTKKLTLASASLIEIPYSFALMTTPMVPMHRGRPLSPGKNHLLMYLPCRYFLPIQHEQSWYAKGLILVTTTMLNAFSSIFLQSQARIKTSETSVKPL